MFIDPTVLNISVFVAVILVSITIHEATHAFVAHWLGDATAKDDGRLTLNPLRHIDPLMTVALPVILVLLGLPPILIAKPVPFDMGRVRFGEFGAAIMAVAGPLSNLAMAAIAAIVLRLSGVDSGLLGQFGVMFVYVNILFFVFNMIPFPPLDGSRLLYAFAPGALRRIMLMIESLGVISIFIFILLLLPLVGPVISDVTGKLIYLLLG